MESKIDSIRVEQQSLVMSHAGIGQPLMEGLANNAFQGMSQSGSAAESIYQQLELAPLPLSIDKQATQQ